METLTVPVPPAVRRALGEEVVAEFIPWMEDHFRQILRREGVPRDEYRTLLSRLDGLEKEVALIREGVAATRQEFREDLAAVRQEFRQEQVQTRKEFREDLSAFRREVHEQLDQVHRRIDEMNARFEARLDQMDARWETRLGEMNARLDEMDARWGERMDKIDDRLDRMYYQMIVQTRWIIGALLGIGTVISVLLAIAQFTP